MHKNTRHILVVVEAVDNSDGNRQDTVLGNSVFQAAGNITVASHLSLNFT